VEAGSHSPGRRNSWVPSREHDPRANANVAPDDASRRDAPMRRTVLQAAAGLGTLGFGTILADPHDARAAPAGFVLPPASEAVTPFRAGFPQDASRDLKRRLSMTRWPERETVGDWSQGVPLEKAQALIAYWRDKYDLRRFEARINAFCNIARG